MPTSEDGNVTTSAVTLLPQPEDDGSYLQCVAETHAAPATLEDTWSLTVHCYSYSWRESREVSASRLSEEFTTQFKDKYWSLFVVKTSEKLRISLYG
ncbi:hypothetical protein E2C01_034096 [Portunus trituberculatus]|uniref:Ig-like domain-containing protein n=1 Tax=Portunus trituberculatus TaxID=210409 RepID=A0A5B7F7L2_PORTR|nr:hypothetical protein [Portunus trituberculatus]